MTNAKRKPFLTTRELATVAILAAISAVLFMIEIPVVFCWSRACWACCTPPLRAWVSWRIS